MIIRRVLAGAVAALAIAGSAGAQTPPPSPRPKTDQTVPVTRNMRLSVNNFAGSIAVRTWEKDAVRVEAEHSTRDRINIRPAEAVLRVGVSSERGPSRTVDFVLTVPRWMSVTLDGTYVDVDLEGIQGEVSAETVGGDVTLKGGSGTVTLKSVEGIIDVEGAKGRMLLTTVNEGVFVRDAAGEITAETVNGDVTLERIESGTVDVATVNGDVLYDGSIRDGGTYRFATHNGDVEMRVPDQINASVFVRTYRGDFSSHFQVQVPEAQGDNRDERGRHSRRNRRFNFTLGSGAARIELESFGGDIDLLKRSQVKPRQREEDRIEEF